MGLTARLPPGLTFLLLGALTFNLIFLRLPSLISPAEPAPSPSLPEPAPPRDRLSSFPRAVVGFFCPGPRFTEFCAGDLGREAGSVGVFTPEPRVEAVPCLFFCFLRDDSLPLPSDPGDPARFKDLEEAER